MPLPTTDDHGLLGPIVTVVIAACSAMLGALTMAFTSGKRFGQIQIELESLRTLVRDHAQADAVAHQQTREEIRTQQARIDQILLNGRKP